MMKMGKKLLTFTLAAFTLTALSGCGKENRSSSETANTATEVSSDTTSENIPISRLLLNGLRGSTITRRGRSI